MDFQVGEYYWVLVNDIWEICYCIKEDSFPEKIAFEMMGVEGNVYPVSEVKASIHIDRPTGW
jgi:hypothetical protein